MRSVFVVLVLSVAAPGLAQRETRVTAHDTMCWSNSQAPCEDISRAEVDVQAGTSPARVRVVSVEVMPENAAWLPASNVVVRRQLDFVRTMPPNRRDGVVRFAAHEHDLLQIFFTPIRAFEGRVRVTLEVDGRRVVLEAAHTVLTEHPDPEL